jgi:ATP-binding cassette subfamily F protein uup
VLVTHDRYMLDRISTVVLGLDGAGGAGLFADYAQWEVWIEEQREAILASAGAKAQDKKQAATDTSSVTEKMVPESVQTPARKKLSYMEAREYATLEQRIAGAEELLRQKRAAAEDPAIASDAARLLQSHAELEQAQKAVDQLYQRWAELEGKLG